MNTFARAFTVRSVVAWPTIAVAVVWAIVANLGDSAYNGMSFPLQRALVVSGLVLLQFGLTWLIDRTLLRRLSSRPRAIALLTTFVLTGWIRGTGIAVLMFAIGASPDLMVAGRIIAATIQTLEISLLALAYGALMLNARQLRELAATSAQLAALAEQADAVREADDSALIERVRNQLKASLRWASDATPDEVLSTLNRSIEELVRPLSRALTEDVSVSEAPSPSRVRVDWRSIWRSTLDSDQLRLGWAVAVLLFVLTVPNVSVFGAWGFAIAVGMSAALWLVMAATRWVVRFAPTLRLLASPIVLLTGSLTVMSMFWLVFPAQFRLTYVIITPFTLSLATLVPTLMSISLAQSAELADRVSHENERLRWSIARTNEITRQRRAAVASALHGSVQAALASAHLRLQIALRDGVDASDALAQARADAERAVTLAVDLKNSVQPTYATLRELTSGWAGVTELRFDVATDAIDADPVAARLVADVFSESVLNAVKHASAAWVELSATVGEPSIELIVRNPSSQVAAAGQPGGGTLLLERSTIVWSRTSDDGVTTLLASIPYDPAEGKP